MIGYNTKNKIIYVIQLVFIIAISVSGVIYTRKYCDMQQGMCMYSYMDIYMNSVCYDINVIAASQIFLIIYLINMDYILSPNIIVRLNERENIKKWSGRVLVIWNNFTGSMCSDRDINERTIFIRKNLQL